MDKLIFKQTCQHHAYKTTETPGSIDRHSGFRPSTFVRLFSFLSWIWIYFGTLFGEDKISQCQFV